MTETVTIAYNATIAKLIEPSREAKLAVQDILSYQVSGAENSVQFKAGHWDGRSSFLNFKQGTFPAGFALFVGALLRTKGFEMRFAKKPLPEPLGVEKPKVDSYPEDPRYDYQQEVVEKLLKHGAMIAQVATGGGKSRIAKLVYGRIKRPTLFLTTRSILMYQMAEAFEKEMGVPVSILGDGQFGHTIIDEYGNERQAIKPMCAGMVQTLTAKLKEPDPRDPIEKQQKQAAERSKVIALLAKFEVVIGEEAHEASGNSYYEILKHCVNARYRLALTATPFMKEDEESNMMLMASFGPIGIKVSEKELIDRGILARPYFKRIDLIDRPSKLFRTTDWQAAYRLGITENYPRNIKIVAEAKKAAAHGLPIMILVQRKEHGNILRTMLSDAGLKADYIFGENDQDQRKRALKKLGSGQINVLIGSTILDVGVDVPSVGMVILAGGGKAEVALRQRVGRGLRAKKSGANIAFIVDFNDQYNKHLTSHTAQRFGIIDSTPGFNEQILKGDEDFPYHLLATA